ncbi:hypothetical protein C7M84_021711 [Penaeus vannamei]|uniref:Uncharacterized protein n=1 Tax=Penaeus vannamei TaxID=6689 RepID=A0A423U8I6_PENVA|nr:hypothetical protein C7M84_021711 [Penaeus vannamei]
MARLYGTAMILKKQDSKHLDVILGDGEAHFAVTRSTNADGQAYLGFYVEGQKILSPQAHASSSQKHRTCYTSLSPFPTTSIPFTHSPSNPYCYLYESKAINRYLFHLPSAFIRV